ncbi:hypothetical protein [Solwaraspora sp. WMMD792]|uniref:hypothetical protein n=1 Tax=Solwaraspora sp. WMMD792 TaxID=3016099 RepID=UPI002415BA51|nr:hypothetical protein [Solwaraspora sp. WMMD792]MDG4774352.1 hypothetical protein [Solwaraspora sp. WMMD792]
MGVLYDYFRSTDDDAAIALMDELAGGPVARAAGADGVAVDAVDLKWIDPPVALGQLVSFVRDAPWRAGLVQSRLLWSPEEEGPWLFSLDDATRDTLASISDGQLPELSARWGRIDEFAHSGPLPEGELVPVIEAIAGLARRARDAGDHLYCWCCL